MEEFFELFKTPWEFCREGRDYDVIVSDGTADAAGWKAPLTVIYHGKSIALDAHDVQMRCLAGSRVFVYQGSPIPIHGNTVTFPDADLQILTDSESRESAIDLRYSNGVVQARIGYDLFREVHTLLSTGQPARHASIPTLDLHIALLRDLIVNSGAPLLEIPPAPAGYQFVACLTHDVDHPEIRRHKFDHTLLGFLYRALVGSLIRISQGRLSLRHLLKNWASVLKLPFIHLGVARDFWRDFERYPTLEKERSSFFVIPFKGNAGGLGEGSAPYFRASSYGAAEIASKMRALQSEGCEVGLHGINAWCSCDAGRQELEEIRCITGDQPIGVRMHWLYFDESSPVVLEEAGADYDSTLGYNETVGYRVGTSQVYKPLNARHLMELPLHIMDTALFYSTHLNLSEDNAWKHVRAIIEHAERYGGVVTINWHDRSIAPERCWEDFYLRLIDELRHKGAWFATASEAVAWFRKRRASGFAINIQEPLLSSGGPGFDATRVPELTLRAHNRARAFHINTGEQSTAFHENHFRMS